MEAAGQAPAPEAPPPVVRLLYVVAGRRVPAQWRDWVVADMKTASWPARHAVARSVSLTLFLLVASAVVGFVVGFEFVSGLMIGILLGAFVLTPLTAWDANRRSVTYRKRVLTLFNTQWAQEAGKRSRAEGDTTAT